MATEKQFAANRRNSLKSTGPRSAVGKLKSSRNALKFGLYSSEAVLPDEDHAEFETLGRLVRADLKPVGAVEAFLVETILTSIWRLRRLVRVESGLFQLYRVYEQEDGGVATAFAHDASQLGCLSKLPQYETSLQRGLFRALGHLERLQAARLGFSLPVDLEVEAPTGHLLPEACRVAKPIAAETSESYARNPFHRLVCRIGQVFGKNFQPS
jgi:hypothetical protein